MLPRPFTITFLGRSGCGKGTQAKLLMERFEIELYFSTGDLFRALSEQSTLAGKKVAEMLKSGDLLPDWLALTLWQRELIDKLVNSDQDIVFDGAPRHVSEAQAMEDVMTWFGRPAVIPVLVDVTRDEAFKRLKLRNRADDTDENINRRLDWYESDVVPILEYYETQERLLRVDGMSSPDEVAKEVARALGFE